MSSIDSLITKMSGWIDNLFGIFNAYSKNYARYLVYALILWILSKMFKFKFNFSSGEPRHKK